MIMSQNLAPLRICLCCVMFKILFIQLAIAWGTVWGFEGHVPWTTKKECVAPRKPFEPQVLLKDTLVNNRNDPPLDYMGCDMERMHFWGQAGEDGVIYNRFFKNRKLDRPGYFVEMGGLDGVTFSNTLIFEQCLGWHGMLIEGNSFNVEEMARFRPCAHNVWAIACPPRTSYSYITKATGVSEVLGSGERKGSNHIMAPCRTLASVFREYGVEHIDFFSLDVEGFEAEVLSTINFQKVKISVLIVELDRMGIFKNDKVAEKNKKVHDILTAAGMHLMPSKVSDLPVCQRKKKIESTLHGSAIYVSTDFRDDICQ